MELDLQLFGGRGGGSGIATAESPTSMQDTYGQMAEAKSGITSAGTHTGDMWETSEQRIARLNQYDEKEYASTLSYWNTLGEAADKGLLGTQVDPVISSIRDVVSHIDRDIQDMERISPGGLQQGVSGDIGTSEAMRTILGYQVSNGGSSPEGTGIYYAALTNEGSFTSTRQGLIDFTNWFSQSNSGSGLLEFATDVLREHNKSRRGKRSKNK